MDRAGVICERGLTDTVLNAHLLQGITDPSPVVQFGIYRLLTAFVMDAFGISTIDHLENALLAGSFAERKLRPYLERYSDRFDLFHPEWPFLQCGVSGTQEKPDNLKSVAYLLQQIPSGTNATHFFHGQQDHHAFSPAVCARALCTISPFMTAGGQGNSPSINGVPPWYVQIRGQNLFETLLLNCFVLPMPRLNGGEPPAWRSHLIVSKQEKADVSLLEGLTWRPRRVRLIPCEGGQCTYTGSESNILVREMVFSSGFSARTQEVWQDPQVAYRITDKGSFSLKPSADRALWRDTGPMLLLQQHTYRSADGKVSFQRPLIVSQFVHLRENRIISKDSFLDVEAYGLETDGKMKMIDWRFERLSMPSAVVKSPSAGPVIQAALEQAEKTSFALGIAVKTAYPREGQGNRQAFGNIVSQTQHYFWSSLEPEFERLIHSVADAGLDSPEDVDEVLASWKAPLRSKALQALEQGLGGLGNDSGALRRQVAARQDFWRRVTKIFGGVPTSNPSVSGGKVGEPA